MDVQHSATTLLPASYEKWRYTMERRCRPWAKDAAQTRLQRKIQFFNPARPLEFVVMDNGPLPKTMHGNQHVVDVSDRFSKMMRAIKTQKPQLRNFLAIFRDH